jgi:hypothetical protein
MTDVRERVARAIAKVLYLDGVPGDDTVTGTPYLLSDAALSALGWEEMVEALDRLLNPKMMSIPDPDWKGPPEHAPSFAVVIKSDRDEDIEFARSALSRARGEKT